MAQCFLSAGSNLGNRRENIDRALALVTEKAGDIVKLSDYYETEPWRFESESKFINIAVEIETELQPFDLLHITQEIERKVGRKEKSVGGVYHDRIIDIDLLFYDSLLLETDELTLPHPLLHRRPFVLIPLLEIANNFIHPVYNKTIKELLEVAISSNAG